MTAQLFEISPADVAPTTDDYYTPRWIFDAAGIMFDTDVCAPVVPEFRTCPARRYLTVVEDGLSAPWDGLVWMNPPYSKPRPWIERFAEHNSGLALLPTARDTAWLGTLMHCADAITLLSVHFGKPDGSIAGCRFSLILAACGDVAVEALSRVAMADRCVRGAYHVKPHPGVESAVRAGKARVAGPMPSSRNEGCETPDSHPHIGLAAASPSGELPVVP